ncbi:MAG TPA: hypothetical protein VGJ00_09435 [Rhabdochlamydiaceae bacterium]|jgi:hypothetical protein
MKLNDRQKMCTTCDGRIPLDANLCPYCAAEQGTSGQVYLQHKSIQESLTSLYPPPYASKLGKEQTSKNPTPQEPMSEKRFQHAPSAISAQSISLDQTEQENSAEDKSSFWPLLLLSIGANLLVLGLLQLFFSDNGLLTLQWNSQYWFLYCLAALPLLFLGFKKIQSAGGPEKNR